ncbi:rab family [Anaeramoeba flamelloides]|nr:rab family [Anaeramoeba flamelloides]
MLSKGFYRGAKIVILVYDLSDKRSWKNIVDWYNSAQENFRQYDNNTSLEFLLLGNKSDLNNIKVDEDEVKQWCLKKDNMVNIKCSAKTGKNVTKAFKLIISHVINPEFKKIYNLEKPISADVEN